MQIFPAGRPKSTSTSRGVEVLYDVLGNSVQYGGLSLSLEICQRFYEKTFQLNKFFNKNVKQKIINT